MKYFITTWIALSLLFVAQYSHAQGTVRYDVHWETTPENIAGGGYHVKIRTGGASSEWESLPDLPEASLSFSHGGNQLGVEWCVEIQPFNAASVGTPERACHLTLAVGPMPTITIVPVLE